MAMVMDIITKGQHCLSAAESGSDKPLFVLIDYENIQTEDLSCLSQPDMHLLLFIGALQTKISTKLALQMQALGSRAQYIQIEGTGQNALDMCIAHHTGFILARMPSARFLIISKDKGYDPLIQFLTKRGVPINRRHHLGLPLPSRGLRSAQQPPPLKLDTQRILEMLKKHDKSRPASRQSLISWTMNKVSSNKITMSAEKIITDLEKNGVILFDGKRVVYSLP
uniref:PIN-like domain-containing protein n=3 Tax=Acetobacteraceae TaxID=433 RepID=A0A0S3JQ30_ACEPA|nr:hypothetical protein DB34_15050 [Acetobacter pasteurianus]